MKGKKVLSLVLTVALAASILVLPAGEAGAAKKAALSKKSVTVKVGATAKVKVKNANKKAKVSWKVASKKVATIAKKSTKGKKAYATVKGVAAGKTKLNATYKLGKKKTKLSCKIVVTEDKADNGNTTPAGTTTKAPDGTATKAPNGSAAPSASAPADKTATPTRSPRPTATPTATPVPDPDAEIAKSYVDITVDGTIEAAWDFVDWMPIENFAAADGKTRQTNDSKFKLLWTAQYLYVLVEANDASIDTSNSAAEKTDSVEIFFDQFNSKGDYESDKVLNYRQVIDASKKGAATDASKWDGEAPTSAVKVNAGVYDVEFAIPLDKTKGAEEGKYCGLEIQINDCAGGDRNGILTAFSHPAKPDADDAPAKSSKAFGNCVYAVKRVKKVITLNLKDSDLRNMEKPAQFVGNTDYDTMNSECYFDDDAGKIYCRTANNVFLKFPEGRTVLNTEKAEVEIKGTYSGSNGFRIWLCDTRTGVSDEAATCSDQPSFTPEEGSFDVSAELVSRPSTSASWTDNHPGEDHDGNSNALMIKASTWNGMLEDLVIESVVITVEDPILNIP